MNLVQVLQGEGGTVRGLLEHTASLTTALANRDQLIGDVITNLSETLDTVNRRHVQLSDLVIELRDWMRDLARDRKTIGGSLDNISDLTVTVADLLRRGRPLLKRDIAALRDLAKLPQQPRPAGRAGRPARPDARGHVRPDPHRHLRLLVPVLRLRRLRADSTCRCWATSRSSTRSRTSSAGSTSTRPRRGVKTVTKTNDARIMRMGVITLVVMAVISAATFNLSKFPGFRGTTYYAEFSDASGIHKGNIVQVGGIRVGRVSDVTLDEDRVDREVRDRRRRRQVRAGLQGLDRGAQPAGREVPRRASRTRTASSRPATPSRSSRPSRPTTSSACSAT